MKQVTITNSQKDATWNEINASLPENADEWESNFSRDAMYSLAMEALPIKIRRTSGSPEDIEKVLKGQPVGSGARSVYASLIQKVIASAPEDKKQAVEIALEFGGASKIPEVVSKFGLPKKLAKEYEKIKEANKKEKSE